MTDQKAIAIFTGLKMMVGTEAKEACDVAISALQEREERSKVCRFCFDATLEPDLEGCDLSYHYVGAVSYTHLDVYKRQVFRYRGDPLSAVWTFRSADAFRAWGIYRPVSYTHLDVYKRQRLQ